MEGNGLLALLVFSPMAAGLLVYILGRYRENVRDLAVIFATALEFVFICYGAVAVGNADLRIENICGLGLHLSFDGFQALYGMVAAFMWVVTALFSKEYLSHDKHRNRYYLFNLITLGAILGVFLSADLFTAFIFFEIMSFTSYVWVAQEESRDALKAAETYLAVAVIGGLVMLMGLFLLWNGIGTLEMSELLEASRAYENKGLLYVAGICILFGYGAKAGAFPLHIWLPKAHPVAPAPASALLSGILTKSGIFGILVISCNIFQYDENWGRLILVLGLLTMFGGALLAVFSVDLKRTLACSSVSQVGFILTGIGMQCILGEENALAVRGTLLHMVNHSLFKLVLFLAAGVVFMNIHKLDLNGIRGYGRKKPLLHVSFLMGALGISGIPFWSGYISKTLLHESIVEGVALASQRSDIDGVLLLGGAEWIFLISGGMTICYMAKLYITLFWEKNANQKIQASYDAQKKYMTHLSSASLLAAAVLLPVMGFFPWAVMDGIADMGQGFMHLDAFPERVHYFDWTNLKGGFISIALGILFYAANRAWLSEKKGGALVYRNCWPKWLDLENMIYRPLLLKILPFILGVICRALDSLVDGMILLLRKTVYKDREIPHELSEGTELTHVLGCIFDWFRALRYKIMHRQAPEGEVSYEHRFAVRREKIVETNTIIGRSLSFGLLLFYVGLVFTLIYLLVEG